jgi:hypothetical protein
VISMRGKQALVAGLHRMLLRAIAKPIPTYLAVMLRDVPEPQGLPFPPMRVETVQLSAGAHARTSGGLAASFEKIQGPQRAKVRTKSR